MQKNAAFDALIAFGLDEKSATAYIGLLKLQRATVLQLSREAKLERSGLYAVLEDLTKRGLVHEQVDERGSKLYIPAAPNRLIDLERERYSRLESSLPLLLEAYGAKPVPADHPELSWLGAKNTLEEIYADIVSTCAQLPLPERSVVSVISQTDQMSLPALLQTAYVQACQQHQITNRQAAVSLPGSSSIFVYGSKLALVAIADGYGMILEHTALATLQRSLLRQVIH